MNVRLLLLGLGCCVLWLWSAVSASAQAWRASDYEAYDQARFASYGPANARINFSAIDYALLNAAIFYETNNRRQANGLAPLTYSRALEKAAFEHSVDMVESNFFSHDSPIPGKQSMSARLEAVGVSSAAGENIATSFALQMERGKAFYSPSQNGGYFSYDYRGTPIPAHTYLSFARAVLDQWMDSPGHRANILSAGYRFFGAGAVLDRMNGSDAVPKFKATQCFAGADAKPGPDITIEYERVRARTAAQVGTYTKGYGPEQGTAAPTPESPRDVNLDDPKKKLEEKKEEKYGERPSTPTQSGRDDYDEPPYKPEKPRKSKSERIPRFALRLGGQVFHHMGTAHQPANFFDAKMVNWNAEGMLAYRYKPHGDKKRCTTFGVWARYGGHSDFTLNRLIRVEQAIPADQFQFNGRPATRDTTTTPNYFYEAEVGFQWEEIFRTSVGVGMQEVTIVPAGLPAMRTTMELQYFTATLGVTAKIAKNVRWFVQGTAMMGGDYERFGWRFGTGVALQLNFIRW